ncbi:MurR/RpiR family transcriptional regulator [Corynebacterium variabile]|uniref:MurR/RpiR family transcriptional regulator n=1 Tax=Corynebacterium variabile TaxID=1727 RepID=UPI002647EAB5|nr:MurR/RpiR family transcriptional regulator [Corynebacterium variabile]MDN6478525.1 MurR/RpiR family transcriptional regulator [Corynebacterium variabile]MDN6618245.1 MurR/RpiR family transcriptional regulator [Corynebacterium variabile]
MQLVDRIAAHRSELTPAEIRVAEFMADNPHRVGYLSALKLAEASRTSDATVVRTVRKLGFDGFDDQREQFAVELSRAGRMESTIRALVYEPESEVTRYIAESAEAVGVLPERVGQDALADAVEVIAAARCVVLVGSGPARSIADYAAHRFRRVGVWSVAAGSSGRSFADELAAFAAGDIVVLMSYDRATVEVSVLYGRAAALDIPVVQLSEGVHTVDPQCAVVLGVGRGNPGYSPSYAPTVVVLEALVLAVAASDPDRSAAAGAVLDELRDQLS